jgi:hypothetical protein
VTKSIAIFGTIVLLGISANAGAATPEAQVMTPVHAFIDGFNKGDMKAASAALSPNGMTIIDDVAPHVWSGPSAFDAWSKALDAASQAEGDTDEFVAIGKPTRVIVGADRGYVVVPAIYTYKQKGMAMQESARLVCTVQKEMGGWLITGWAWAGTKPAPVAAAAK